MSGNKFYCTLNTRLVSNGATTIRPLYTIGQSSWPGQTLENENSSVYKKRQAVVVRSVGSFLTLVQKICLKSIY